MSLTLLIEEGPIETRAALLQDEKLLEIHIERPDNVSRTGAFYLGRIAKILPDMNIAFVDIGGGESGFLQLADRTIKASGIATAVREGERLLLQIRKDPKGDKGVQLGNRFELTGRYLVLRPGGRGLTFAKQLRNPERQAHLSKLLSEATQGAGLTVRTAAAHATDSQILAELTRLQSDWETVRTTSHGMKKPGPVGPLPSPLSVLLKKNLLLGCRIIVNNVSALAGVRRFLTRHAADFDGIVSLWQDQAPLFEAMGVEVEIETAQQARISLLSGANIIIEPTEALTVIDVNSAAQTMASGTHSAALAVNLEAAEEICRQIRLRNISGILIIDFIQMNGQGDVAKLTASLQSRLDADPVASRVIGMTELGLMQITRKRERPTLRDLLYIPCPACDGNAIRKSDSTLLAELFRALEREARHTRCAELKVRAGTGLALLLQKQQTRFETELARPLVIETDGTMAAFDYQLG